MFHILLEIVLPEFDYHSGTYTFSTLQDINFSKAATLFDISA
jgi:hypothetical protein